jgi:DNA helicase TIP49 (TBP-interacting protein)
MYPKILVFGLLFLLLSVGAVKAVENPSTEPNPQIGSQGQQAITGTLESISDTNLSLKTTEGETKLYSIKTEKKSQIQTLGLKKGDRITAQLDQQNQVIEVTKSGSAVPSGG